MTKPDPLEQTTDPTLVRHLRLQLAQERERADGLHCELVALVGTCRAILEARDLAREMLVALDLSTLDDAIEAYERRHPEDAKRKRARS